MQMVTSLMDFLKQTKQMVMEYISTKTGKNIMDNGQMTSSKGWERKLQLMEVFIKESFMGEKSMEEVFTNGQMERNTAENGETTKSMDLVHMTGQTEDNMKENGGETNCTTEVYTRGLMVANMMENTQTIKNMVGVFISGPMVKSTKDIGIMASSTVRADSQTRLVRTEQVFGSMVKELNGYLAL